MSEPAYVRAFKGFTKKEPLTLADIDLLEKEIYGISDRASGILLADLVDSALQEAIKSALRPDLSNAMARDLFDFEGSIGTFGSRITLGCALNLFGPATYHDLKLIQMIAISLRISGIH